MIGKRRENLWRNEKIQALSLKVKYSQTNDPRNGEKSADEQLRAVVVFTHRVIYLLPNERLLSCVSERIGSEKRVLEVLKEFKEQ